MKFCNVCDNMLYIRTDAGKTMYLCKMCNNIEPLSDGATVCITDSKIRDDDIEYKRFLSPLLKYDVTLPHVSNIVCPNSDCSKKPGEENDVIVVKYNADKLKFLYTCVYCNKAWRNTK